MKKAEGAIARSDRKRADFYGARYLGLCAKEDSPACPDGAFDSFLKKRKLEPKAFIPGEWDKDFLDWFEKSVRVRWGVGPERVREKGRSFEIAHAAFQEKYSATIIAYPQLELWHSLQDGVLSKPMVLPMGSFRDRPTLYFGKTMKGTTFQSRPTFLETQKRTLHYVWDPEFFDLDGDGQPEVWVRFNLAWGNGFCQVLDVYRIGERGLELVRHFEGVNDGFARRLPDGTVEVADSVRAKQDTHRVETWKFDNKEFKKVGEKKVPFVLKTPEWRDVFTIP